MKYLSITALFLSLLCLFCKKAENQNPINWATGHVSLEAENFFLIANGDTFYGNVADVDLHSDPGDSTYCTLEVTWEENSVEMRLNMYFGANGSDWWASELRTYDGQPQGDWIYYTGEFFKSPLDSAFTSDIEIESDALGNDTNTGKIHFDGIALKAFLNL